MKKNQQPFFIGLGALALLLLVALWWAFRPTPEASEPIVATPLATQLPTTPPIEPTMAPVEATTAPVEATTTPAEATAAPVASGETKTFEIVSAESQARFSLNEVLRGDNIEVIGTTNQVAGQLRFNPSDLSSAEIGAIQINARTLATDNEFRNRAIERFILETGTYEYITFTPKQITGLPASVALGETVNFAVTGDLTIKDVTKEVTFDGVVNYESAETISGTATVVVAYADFGLAIPDGVPGLTQVDEVTTLAIAFRAQALP